MTAFLDRVEEIMASALKDSARARHGGAGYEVASAPPLYEAAIVSPFTAPPDRWPADDSDKPLPAKSDARADRIDAENIPAEWVDGLAILPTLERPETWTATHWRILLTDAGVFLDMWGARAAALGWSTTDLFGLHVTGCRYRLDCRGLVPSIQGGHVTAITDTAATIKTRRGAAQHFTRLTMGKEVKALWDFQT